MECTTCGQYFTNEYDLVNHMMDSHTTDPNYNSFKMQDQEGAHSYNPITGQGDGEDPRSYNPFTGQGSY